MTIKQPTREEVEAKTSILKGMDDKEEQQRRRELWRSGFSEYEIMIVTDPPEQLKALIDEMVRQVPYFIPMRIKRFSWGPTYLRDVKGNERGNIYCFPVGAALSPLDRGSTIFSEFSPELIILPTGKVCFTRSRVHYRGGLNRDIKEFHINVEEQRKFILERMAMEFNRDPSLRSRFGKRGRKSWFSRK